MKSVREPASSRPKSCASLKKPHKSCPFAVPCWSSEEENRPWSEISFSPRNIPVRTLYFGLATWIQQSHPASPRQSSVLAANLMLTHKLISSLPLSAAVHRFGAMTVNTNGLVYGFNWQCSTKDIGHAVSWSQHAWTPYRFLTSKVWVHPGREVARAGRGGVVLELSILRADVVLSFSSVTFVLFCFDSFSSFLLSLKPWLFVQTFFVLRYACAPTDTRSYLTTSVCVLFSFLFFPFFLFLWRCRFFRVFLYHYRFLFVWRVRRTFPPSGWCFSTL